MGKGVRVSGYEREEAKWRNHNSTYFYFPLISLWLFTEMEENRIKTTTKKTWQDMAALLR